MANTTSQNKTNDKASDKTGDKSSDKTGGQSRGRGKTPLREMLVNFVTGEECRIALTTNGRLEELYQERSSAESHVGNIYKGRVTNVEQSIQAAFVDFGLERNGFLHISDVHPQYFPGGEDSEKLGSKISRRDRPPIQKCFRRGDEVLVQVLKEGISTKGPTLTSYLSIPGRFLVMMPNMSRLGVSRKVEDDDARKETRKILAELDPPDGFGFIVRTAGIGQPKADIKRDLAYLTRLWKKIETRRKRVRGVGELYAESDLIIRTLRDVFTSDVDRIIVDSRHAAARAQDFLAIANPRSKSRVVFYDDPVPLFHRFGIEAQIEHVNGREVPLPSGGSLVIEQTEAMVTIDVNSGKSRDARDAEANAYNTDVEACDEICRQLKLRDLGGIIAADMIDMRESKNRRKIEQRFRDNLKNDRARTRVAPIGPFGVLEITRQRMRPSLKKAVSIDCPTCHGLGELKSPESVALEALRQLSIVAQYDHVERIELTVSGDTAFQLLNRKRSKLVSLERKQEVGVTIRVGGGQEHIGLVPFDAKGVALDPMPLLRDRSVTDIKRANLVELSSGEVEELAVAPIPDPDDELDELIEEEIKEEVQAELSGDGYLSADDEEDEAESDEEEGGSRRKRRRRRRRRSRRGRGGDGGEGEGEGEDGVGEEAAGDGSGGVSGGDDDSDREADADADGDDDADSEEEADGEDDSAPVAAGEGEASGEGQEGGGKRKRRRRRGRRGKGDREGEGREENGGDASRRGSDQPQRSGASGRDRDRGDRDRDRGGKSDQRSGSGQRSGQRSGGGDAKSDFEGRSGGRSGGSAKGGSGGSSGASSGGGSGYGNKLMPHLTKAEKAEKAEQAAAASPAKSEGKANAKSDEQSQSKSASKSASKPASKPEVKPESKSADPSGEDAKAEGASEKPKRKKRSRKKSARSGASSEGKSAQTDDSAGGGDTLVAAGADGEGAA